MIADVSISASALTAVVSSASSPSSGVGPGSVNGAQHLERNVTATSADLVVFYRVDQICKFPKGVCEVGCDLCDVTRNIAPSGKS